MKYHKYLLVVLSLFLILALAACSGDSTVDPTQAPAATDAPAEEPTEEMAEEPTEEAMEEPTEEVMEEPTEEPAEEPAEEMGEPLKIGVLSDLSGGLLLFGNEMWNGLQLGFEYATDGTMMVRDPGSPWW
jgi:glucose/arabinose dehydrogenase